MNKIFSKNHLDRINNKLLLLGVTDNRANMYLTVKLAMIVILCVIIAAFNVYGLLLAPIVFIIMYFLIDYVVINRRIKKRRIEMEKDGVLFFKIVYFSYNNNHNLKVALKVATNNVNNSLSNEFKKALDETNYGKSLYDALNDLEKRIPSNKIGMIISNLNEAIIMGSDASKLLLDQVNFLDLSVKNRYEKMISHIPIKVLVAFSLTILPIIFIIIS